MNQPMAARHWWDQFQNKNLFTRAIRVTYGKRIISFEIGCCSSGTIIHLDINVVLVPDEEKNQSNHNHY